MGKGTEDATNYINTELIYCNIDNIHVMRNSLTMLGELALPDADSSSSASSSSSSLELDARAGGYHAKLDDCGWLKHLRLILVASVQVAEKMHLEGCSVLVHCSDGWDRTAQLTSLTQLLLDPF
jgi:hypothetical protein